MLQVHYVSSAICDYKFKPLGAARIAFIWFKIDKEITVCDIDIGTQERKQTLEAAKWKNMFKYPQ